MLARHPLAARTEVMLMRLSLARAAGDEPFGLSTVAAAKGALSATWQNLQREIQFD